MAELNDHVEKTVKSITLNVTEELAETTPRDTGRASANWRPTTGRPSGEFIPEVQAAKAAQDNGKQDVTGYKLTDGATVIENNAPYIGALNDGHSQAQPAGFVQRAIEKAVLLERLK